MATNKRPAGPTAGSRGCPACFHDRAAIDQVAHELGLDPAEVGAATSYSPDEFPYLDRHGNIYDSGSYVESLDELERIASIDELAQWQDGNGKRPPRWNRDRLLHEQTATALPST